MGELVIAMPSPAISKQMAYAAWFAHELIEAVENGDQQLFLRFSDEVDPETIRPRIERLLSRFAKMDAFESRELFRIGTATVKHDPFAELVERGWVVELGQGQVALRGTALDLLEFFDDLFVRRLAGPAKARHEYYPGVMTTERIDRANHFGSFPEHVQFVMHLREDLDVLDRFATELRAAGGWTPTLLQRPESPLAAPVLVINPAVCYNCYAASENAQLDGDGFVATARSRCHRYEAGNHRTMARLLDFTMREVIYVGTMDFVMREREATNQRLRELVEELGLTAWMETANDPFFTNDFEQKAGFQRRNEMKFELCMPLASGAVAVASSNFHSVTFGKAFNIRIGARPATTGCSGFGLERWIYAVFSQAGCEVDQWPSGLRTAFARWHAAHR